MLRKTFFTIAIGIGALAFGAGSSRANEIDFGAQAPSGIAGCSFTAGDPGFVCSNPQTYSAAGGTFTTIGWMGAAGNPIFDPTAQTWKPSIATSGPPANTFSESGVGENASPPPSGMCSDAECEINAPTTSAGAVTTNGASIDGVVIGSVQTGENWILWTGPGPGFAGLTEFATGTGGSCTEFDSDIDTCVVTGLPDVGAVVVQSGGSGDVLLTSVLFTPSAPPSVPEPATLMLLGTALVAVGVVRRRRKI
jgi:PEP-CTERM motif